MTRKRYIKLLQGCGCDRQTAQSLADLVRYLGRSYAEAVQGDMQYCTYVVKGLGVKMRRGRWYSRYYPKAIAAAARTNMPLYMRHLRLVAIDTGYEVVPFRENDPSRDGYRPNIHIVDEVSQWPKENPHLGGGDND